MENIMYKEEIEKSALIAMSGGLDSSIAAYIMKRDGYRCMGATMRLYHESDITDIVKSGLEVQPADSTKEKSESVNSFVEKEKPESVNSFMDKEKSESVNSFVEKEKPESVNSFMDKEKKITDPESGPADLKGPEPGSEPCCSERDVEDAREVARQLGIPFEAVNYKADFQEKVIDKFIRIYEEGGTPNPCVDCNRYIKFEKMFSYAREKGLHYVVTGHYARIERDEESGRYLLRKSLDESKDQSYVLYSLTQDQLSHIIFPLGNMTKVQARELAAGLDLVTAHKHDSQDICFVPDGDYVKFMEKYTGKNYAPGNFIDKDGKVIGKHVGAVKYTIGQRKGLGIAMGHPVYVCGKDMKANTVTIGEEEELFTSELIADDVNWISIDCLKEPLRIEAKTRYRQKQQPGTVYPLEDGKIRVVFDKPQRAITSGQAVVMYDGDIVVGGATIL